MTRMSIDTPLNGYDYTNQAWYMDGKYVTCGHPAYSFACFACSHAGLMAPTQSVPFVHCGECNSPVRIERDWMAYCSSATCGERIAQKVGA